MTLMILQILAFLFAISLLTLVHEFGHFIVAKRAGVKVLRFSIGFGKPLFHWYDKSGTEYVFAPILFGGYVKLLDSREMEVKAEERHLAFDHKSRLKRALIILAGPIANCLLAFIIFSLLFFIGIKSAKPILGEVITNSVAAKAGLHVGDEILMIDGATTRDWQSVMVSVFTRFGEEGQMAIQIRRGQKILSQPFVLNLPAQQVNKNDNGHYDDPFKLLGFEPYQPLVPPIINEVIKNSPAAQVGIKAQDKIIAIDNQPIKTWQDFVEYVGKKPQKILSIGIMRQKQLLNFQVLTAWRYGPTFKKIGFIGVKSLPAKWPEDMLREQRYSLFATPLPALQKIWLFTNLNYVLCKKLVMGKIPLRVLGGPIAIFQSTAEAFKQGIIIFVSFLAILSVMLAFLNLMPIPGLDGGFLIFLLCETIIRRSLSLKTYLMFYRIGILLLFLLLMQATFNDLVRLFYK